MTTLFIYYTVLIKAQHHIVTNHSVSLSQCCDALNTVVSQDLFSTVYGQMQLAACGCLLKFEPINIECKHR